MKIFDITKKHKFTANVICNIKQLIKTYGHKFYIKDKDNNISVKIIKKTLVASNKQFYALHYDVKKWTHDLLPISIWFYDIHEDEYNNNVYIENIHKTDTISGTNIVLFVLSLLRILNVNKAFLGDGATVKCGLVELDLSFIKLLQHKMTFYMKLGFEPDIYDVMPWFVKFNSRKDIINAFNSSINLIRKIKVKHIINECINIINIITKVIKDNATNKLIVSMTRWAVTKPYEEYIEATDKINISNILTQIIEIIDILRKTDETYLYKYMITLFNNKDTCEQYSKIINYVTKDHTLSYKYNNNIIKRPYVRNIDFLLIMRYNIHYTYDFTKNQS